MHEKE
jgi:hypothetical protein